MNRSMSPVVRAFVLGALCIANGVPAQESSEALRNPAKEFALKKDLAKLQGTWRLESTESLDRAVPREMPKAGTMTITGDQIRQEINGVEYSATMVLDPMRCPKAIDLIPTNGPAKEAPIRGIYTIEDNELILCIAVRGDRPSRFAASQDQVVTTYRSEAK